MIAVDVSGLQDAKTRIKAINVRAKNLTPMWPKVGSYLAAVNRKQFTTRGVYLGTPWSPLQPEYASWKLSHGYGRRPLVLSGALKTSYTSRPMSVERYYKKSALFGSSNRLAPYHQHGTRRNGKRAIPARPVMAMTPQVKRDIGNMIGEYVVNGKVAAKDYI